MEHDGHRARMRERFRTEGLSGFAPHEVLELILFYAIPQRNVNPLAHRLLDQFGSLHAVLDAPPEELIKVDGVGEYAACLLSLFSQVGRKLESSRSTERLSLTTCAAAKEHCLRLLGGLTREHFYAVCLNSRMELLGDALIAEGDLAEVPAYPRLVAEAALRLNAYAVILTHNHPGGSCQPSRADMETTAKLSALLGGMEVLLADHILVAGGTAASLAEMKLIIPSQNR